MNSCSAGVIPYLWVRLFFFTFGAVKVAEQSYLSLNLNWCASRCARKIFCSSPALLAAPLFDWGGRCQGHQIAASDATWIHVSSWMQASLQCKAKELVGCLHWTTWWLPQVVLGSLLETCLCKVGIVKAPLSDDIIPFGKTNDLKHWSIRLNSGRPSSVSARNAWAQIVPDRGQRVW